MGFAWRYPPKQDEITLRKTRRHRVAFTDEDKEALSAQWLKYQADVFETEVEMFRVLVKKVRSLSLRVSMSWRAEPVSFVCRIPNGTRSSRGKTFSRNLMGGTTLRSEQEPSRDVGRLDTQRLTLPTGTLGLATICR